LAGLAWARCSAFAEEPDASIDLLDAQGPAGVRFPMVHFRFSRLGPSLRGPALDAG